MPMAGEVELAPAGTLPPSIQRASSVVVDSGFDFLRFSWSIIHGEIPQQ